MQSLVRFIPEAVKTSLRIFPDCLSKFSSSILGEIKSINKIRSREEKSITDLSFIVLLHSVVLDHIYQVSSVKTPNHSTNFNNNPRIVPVNNTKQNPQCY